LEPGRSHASRLWHTHNHRCEIYRSPTVAPMFRWHSTVVEPDVSSRATTSAAHAAAATTAVPVSPSSVSVPAMEESCIKHAFDLCQSAGERVARDSNGKISDPKGFVRQIERSGVKFGPQGAGTLLAIADARRPTYEEFRDLCARAPGSTISKPVPGPAGRGRGLGHLHGRSSGARGAMQGVRGAPSRGRGRSL
jgi:hypothetical protein